MFLCSYDLSSSSCLFLFKSDVFYVLNFVFMFFNFVKINIYFLNLYVDVSKVMWHFFYNILIPPTATSAISIG